MLQQTSIKTVAIVGTGHRSEMYVDAVLGPHADVARLVALADTNPVRAAYYAERALARGVEVQVIDPGTLSAFVAAEAISHVIITTPDFLHAEYIDAALRAGADVIVEKPLTIDTEGCRRITQAVEDAGRRVTVAFNYRYSPRNSALKKALTDGAIGTVTGVHFEWLLDTAHGADYFRRWHRDKSKSGGLLVHKASHHFDLVNWWIDDTPAQVYAKGGLRFYGDHNARARGMGNRPARGTHDGERDPFQLDLRDDPRLKRLYLDAEASDGYLRDLDAFSPGITIEDNLSVLVGYGQGPTMTYSLNAHAPWEGYRVAINGTEGRLELDVTERAAVLLDTIRVLDPSAVEDAGGAGAVRRRQDRLVLQRHWSEAEELSIETGPGGHGGGDELLLADLFTDAGPDPLHRKASLTDGLRAVAVGIAGNISLETGKPVTVHDLELGRDLADHRTVR